MKKYKQIYIVLSLTGSNFGHLIKFYTKEPYSHVSLAFDKELKEMYSFGRKNPNNPFIAGFVKESLDNGTFFKFKNTECTIYALDITEHNYYKLKKIIEDFKEESHRYSYNLLGILGVMIGHPLETRYKYFCSQFVSHVLMESGVQLFNKPPGLTTPQDFRIYENKKIIYRGKLKEYSTYNFTY
ncbi:hypothetical protein [Clostridium sp. Marseille-Q2269]|uniref:hypothetical protein n=1 Tax=Clostridium sp. Marseille-Q2269 TaxID=2942205 RepID=UPI002072ADE8|nr:hypothetical protein [Clostridium sp. Marseille-Q2269]